MKRGYLDGEILTKCTENRCKQGPLITDENSGEIMCGSCGIVLIEKTIAAGPERTFSGAEFNTLTRAGAGTYLSRHDMGLATVIHSENRDVTGRQLVPQMKMAFKRLRIWDKRSGFKTKERTMRHAFILLEGMVSKLGLSETVSEKAAYYYRKVKRVNSRGGRTTIILISACLYAACKFTNSPRTLIDIANVANLTKKHVQRGYTDLCKKLDLQFESFDPINFVGRLASMAGVKEKTKRYATRLLIEANKKGIVTSKNPMGIAGGVLYLSCVINGENVSQAKIAQISGISNITIRAMYHLVMEELNIATGHKFLETN